MVRLAALRSDHAAILLKYYPITSITLLPPPAPKGYRADSKHYNNWIKAFNTHLYAVE